ncbi:variable surface protein Vir33, truncated, putative, partial [Plasmodium vivax]
HNCISISRQLHNDGKIEFVNPCLKLIHYLKYIKENPVTVDKKKSCKYFNYMLMDELKKISHSCVGTKECYNTVISVQSSESNGIDICKGNIEEFNKVIFDKFNDLNSLYDIFYKFMNTEEKGGSTQCALGKTCSEQYYTHIKICDKNSNIGFCMALDKFKDGYNAYMRNGPTCEHVPRYLYSPFGTEKRRTFSISLITIFAMSTILFTFILGYTLYYGGKVILRNDLYEVSRDLKNNDNLKKNNSKNSPLNIQYHSSENS